MNCRNCGAKCGTKENKVVILTGPLSHCQLCVGEEE